MWDEVTAHDASCGLRFVARCGYGRLIALCACSVYSAMAMAIVATTPQHDLSAELTELIGQLTGVSGSTGKACGCLVCVLLSLLLLTVLIAGLQAMSAAFRRYSR